MFIGTLDPASTRADWELLVAFVDDDTDEPLELSGASIIVELRDRLGGQIVISATTSNGLVSLVDTGAFQIAVPAATMKSLRDDMYEVGGTYTLNGSTRQFVIGLLPVLDGIVTR
jgi:hypothetical protein